MVSLMALEAANARRWAVARLLASREGLFANTAHRLVAAKSRYQAVSKRTGVPWWVIAVIHEREASQNWHTQLGQGDPLNAKSTHVPAGRGPFATWEDGAVDALMNCAPYTGRTKDWSPGATLMQLERYNGTGYAARGLPSPYIWAGTDQYKSGKYVADGVFDPDVVDRQLGCAGLLLAMGELDAEVKAAMHQTGPAPAAAPKPSTKPAAGAAAGTGAVVVAHHLNLGVPATIALVLAAVAAAVLVAHFWKKS